MSRLLSFLLALFVAASVVGCASNGTSSTSGRSSSGPSDPEKALVSGGDPSAENDESGIDVPDVSGGDGDEAWRAVENAELSPTFADANDDISFDSARDGTACEVTDQSPTAGETAQPGDDVEVTIDCAQVDWESQEGAGWEAFSEAYNSGFDDGCQALFDESPDGSLHEDDYEYSVIDCQNLSPGDATGASDLPQEAPQDPQSAGTELGELDGCQALFEEEGVFSLNWGEESITEHDCPVRVYVAPTKKTKRKTKTVGSTCQSQAADASGATIRVDKGEINCAGANALWHEFLRRAPSEGAGSSGYLELEDWACFGSLATDVKKDGGCERTDQSASFTVLKRQ